MVDKVEVSVKSHINGEVIVAERTGKNCLVTLLGDDGEITTAKTLGWTEEQLLKAFKNFAQNVAYSLRPEGNYEDAEQKLAHALKEAIKEIK